MARLATVGFETQRLTTSTTTCAERQGTSITSTVNVNTANPRSGAACAECPPSTEGRFVFAPTMVLDRSYFFRQAIRFAGSVAPNINLNLMQAFATTTGTVVQINMKETTGEIVVFSNKEAKNLAATAFVPTINTWYLFELKVLVPTAGKGKVKFIIRSDAGVVIYESAEFEVELGNLVLTSLSGGHITSAETKVTVLLDDWAVNDSTGEAQNGFPGNGKIVFLKPVTDKAHTGFTGGAGGTTNLWDALNNTPPVGKKLAEATDAGQVKSPNNNSTDNIEVELAAYGTPVAEGGGGIGAADVVKVALAILRGGQNSTTARGMAVQMMSNPAIAESAQGTAGATAEADPTGWTTMAITNAATAYSPAVTRLTKPVLRLRRSVASVDTMMADLAGLYVEYVPMVEVPLQESNGVASATLALQAGTVIPLNASSGVASGTVAVQAATSLTLGESSGVASASLGLQAAGTVPLQPSSGTASASAEVRAPTQIPLQPSTGTATTTLAVNAPTTVPLGPSSGVGSATAQVRTIANLSLEASGSSSATLSMRAPVTVPLSASNGVATTSLAPKVPVRLSLGASSGVATATLAVALAAKLALAPSNGSSSATLAVHAGPRMTLGPSNGVATATITIYYPIAPAYSVRRAGAWVPL